MSEKTKQKIEKIIAQIRKHKAEVKILRAKKRLLLLQLEAKGSDND